MHMVVNIELFLPPQELNIRSAVVTSDEGPFVRTRAEPERKLLGPRLGKDLNKVAQAVLGMFSSFLDLD